MDTPILYNFLKNRMLLNLRVEAELQAALLRSSVHMLPDALELFMWGLWAIRWIWNNRILDNKITLHLSNVIKEYV